MARTFAASQNLNVGNPAALQITGTDFTVVVKANLSVASVHRALASKRDAGLASIAWELRVRNDNKLIFGIGNASNAYDSADGVTNVPTSQRVTFGGIKQGGSLRCYLDGLVDQDVGSSVSIGNSGANFRIGRDDQGNECAGDFCECAVWAKALSDVEMLAFHNGVCPSRIRPEYLRGYWPIFGDALPEVDLSGNRNNAVAVGTPPYARHFPVGRLVSMAA